MMRTAEWINVVYFPLLAALAWFRPLDVRRRLEIAGLGVAGLGLTLLGRFSDAVIPIDLSGALRDWLPAPILLIAYWQAGRFYIAPWDWFQQRLQALDESTGSALAVFAPLARSYGVSRYLEIAYLFAYPLVPLALVVLYGTGWGSRADYFWTVVLPPSYFCYAMLAFVPTLPPRLLDGSGSDALGRKQGRRLNLWVLDRLGIGANTFPSGHVASTIAASLVIVEFLPAAGGVFLWVSTSIAVSVVIRRYHYVADAVLAAALAFGWWFLLGRL